MNINSLSSNATKNKIKMSQKLLPSHKENESSPQKNGKLITSLSNNNMFNKKAQINTKDIKSYSSTTVKESSEDQKINFVLNQEESNYFSNIDSIRTPKKLHTTNYNSYYTSPKGVNKSLTNRYVLSPESEHTKLLNFLNSNNALISPNNLKVYCAPNYQNAKFSTKSLSYIKAYSTNTNQGIIR